LPAIELHEGLTTGGTSGTVPNHTNSAESWSAARARCATPLDRPPPTGVREPCSESIVCAAGHQSPFTTVVLHIPRRCGGMAARQTSRSCYIASGAQLLGRGQVVLAGGGRPGRFGKRRPSVRHPPAARFSISLSAQQQQCPGSMKISLTSSTIWRWLELAHSLALPSRSSRPCIEYGDRAAKDCGSTSLVRRAEA
jgi:hypothetical protein